MTTDPIDPALVAAVHDLLDACARGEDPGDLDALLLEIAAAQGLLQDDPARGLDAIRPVPETAFKLMTVAHFPPSEAEAEFRTSGTTTGAPGRHLVRDLALYRRSALLGFERFVLYDPRPTRFLRLIPTAAVRPASSLTRMADFVDEHVHEAFAASPVLARSGDAVDLDACLGAFRDARDAGEPLCVLATTLDLLTLLEGMAARGLALRLPAGSRVMHTGGPKATGRAIRREDLRQELEARLGIPPEDAVEEYGMTELLSQAYDATRVTPGPRRLVPVPWMRCRVLDPVSLLDVPDGQRGLVCHYDAANVHTAVAVLTGDMATRVQDGFADVVRAVGAGPRGCSQEAATRVL